MCMDVAHRFIQLADLHLSDNSHTATHHALQWAVEFINRQQPDFLAVGGDVTTFGTAASSATVMEALNRVGLPVFFTPGNAELRCPDALLFLRDLVLPDRRYTVRGNLLALFHDTSSASLSIVEREWLDRIVAAHSSIDRRIIITHYPLDVLGAESRAWLVPWLVQQHIDLLVAGHRHTHRKRWVNGCLEIVTRGLDPDKAIGDMPGISVFESSKPGEWCEQFYPWPPPIELLPADLPNGISPVGWSIHGNPVDAARETLEFGLSCLEFRPRVLDFSRKALSDGLQRLHDRGALFLSYHLPSLTWNPDTCRIEGEDALRVYLECALESGVDSLTVHVPQAPACEMEQLKEDALQSTKLYQESERGFAQLFREPARTGIRIAIENVHNTPRTPVNAPHRKFTTTIDEYRRWIDTVARSMADIPGATVGTLLDVGHARNSGGDLDNLQPLCDWYARLGHHILGYHIHQVDNDPDTGKLSNHKEITSFFGKRVSYAGFLWAWSTHQITRGPLFVEVRGNDARRNTALCAICTDTPIWNG